MISAGAYSVLNGTTTAPIRDAFDRVFGRFGQRRPRPERDDDVASAA